MPREFSIVRELSRREIERHAKRFIGITIAEPEFRDQNGLTEWVVDIRIGWQSGWAVIKDCLIAQWALGVVTDINIPVLAERSEAGRVTIIARSELRLSDEIRVATYNFEDLDFAFMRNLRRLGDGSLVDGYGYPFALPDTDGNPTEYTPQPGSTTTYTWNNSLIEWGSTDFDYGTTLFGERRQEWLTS